MKFFLAIFLLISGNVAAQVNTSPNMNLPVPIPGITPGPAWAQYLAQSLNQIDSHNHSFGQGVQIQPNGLNISSDLTFNGNNATQLRTTRFSPQASPIGNASPDVGNFMFLGMNFITMTSLARIKFKLLAMAILTLQAPGFQAALLLLLLALALWLYFPM